MDAIAYVLNTQTERVLAQKVTADRVHRNLTALLQKADIPGTITFFGSFTNGFNTGDSDFDVTLVTDTYVDPKMLLQKIAALYQAYEFTNFTTILQAQVPILKFADSVDGIEVDLSINNRLGIRNSELLATYCSLHPRISPLGRLVKEWARRREIVGTADGCLNAYAYMLMVIFFLQVGCDPPICVSLQSQASIVTHDDKDMAHNADNASVMDTLGYTWDTRFLSDLDSIPASGNDDSLEKLLHDFFHFYANVFDWNSDAVCIHVGQLHTKKQWLQCFQGHKDCTHLWCIADPFDLRRNLAGKTTMAGRHRIIEEMRAALQNINHEEIASVITPQTNPQLYYLKCRLTNAITLESMVQKFEPLRLQKLYFPKSQDRSHSPYAFLEFKSEEDRRLAFTENETLIAGYQLRMHATVQTAVKEALAMLDYSVYDLKKQVKHESPIDSESRYSSTSLDGDHGDHSDFQGLHMQHAVLNPQATPFFPPSMQSYSALDGAADLAVSNDTPVDPSVSLNVDEYPFSFDNGAFLEEDALAYPDAGLASVVAQYISLDESVTRGQRTTDEGAACAALRDTPTRREMSDVVLQRELEHLREHHNRSIAPPAGFSWRIALFHTIIHAVPVLHDDDWEDMLLDAMGHYVDTHIVPQGYDRAQAWQLVDEELHALLREIKTAVDQKTRYLTSNVPAASHFHDRTLAAAAETIAKMPPHIPTSSPRHRTDVRTDKSGAAIRAPCDDGAAHGFAAEGSDTDGWEALFAPERATKLDRSRDCGSFNVDGGERAELLARIEALEREADCLRREKDSLADVVDAMKKCWNDLPVMMLPHFRAMVSDAPPAHRAETEALVAKEIRSMTSRTKSEASMREFAMKCGTMSSIRQLLRNAPVENSNFVSNVHEDTLWGLNATLRASMNPARSTSFGFNVRGVIEEVCACGLIAPLIRLMETYKGHFAVLRQAVGAIANLVTSGSDEQVYRMMDNDLVRPLCSVLDTNDADILSPALDALIAILRAGCRSEAARKDPTHNPYRDLVEDACAVKDVKRLTTSDHSQVRWKAFRALQFFVESDATAEASEREGSPRTLLGNLGGKSVDDRTRGRKRPECKSDDGISRSVSSHATSSSQGSFVENHGRPGARKLTTAGKECGSNVNHKQGTCKPCAFFYHKADGCRRGAKCSFCHLCSPKHLREKKKIFVKRAPSSVERGSKDTVPLPPCPVSPPPTPPDNPQHLVEPTKANCAHSTVKKKMGRERVMRRARNALDVQSMQ